MKHKITLLAVLFISAFGFAQTNTFNNFGNWSLPSNWSLGHIPTDAENVVIPGGLTCFINIPGRVANYLTVDPGSTLYITAGATLTVGGFTQNGTFTIDSNASNNGSFIVSGGGGGGTVTYQRYLKGAQWHLITAPVYNSQTIASFVANYSTSMTKSGVKYSLATYDNSFAADGTSTWKNYTSDGSNPPPATSFIGGYEIRYDIDKTVNFTGTVGLGGIGIPLTANTTGWNLIGNPFPSSLFGNVTADATNNFLTANGGLLDPSFVSMYIWNPTNGSYDIINNASGARYLAPGQAFFVKANSGGSNATFTASMQTHQTTNNFQKEATTSIPTINLTLDNNTGIVRSTDIKYMSGATLGLDSGYDAGQFGAVGTSNFNLYTHLVQDNGVKFALQVVPDTDYDTTVIPIGIDANAGTQITFKATATDLPTDKKVFLEDKLLNTVTEINHTDKTYTVNLSTNLSGTGRFFLHTKANNTLAIDNYVASQYTLVTSPEQHNIRLYGAVAEKGSINIFDSFGRIIYTTTLQKGTEQDINVPIMSTGIYILKFNIDNKPFSKKIVWY